MEVMKFIRIFKRYCDKQCQGPGGCHECAFGKNSVCRWNMDVDINLVDKELIEDLEDWAKKNPAKTRQSELMKLYPKVNLDSEGVIKICPIMVDTSVCCDAGRIMHCEKCRHDYWMEEVD